MKVKNPPPFMYYGGKAVLAPWIVSHFPEHRLYVEPFAGSAAVLLAKSESHQEVLNDLNGGVVNFFQVIRDRPEELMEKLRLTPYARDEYFRCRDNLMTDDPIEYARRFFVVTNLAFNASPNLRVGFSSPDPRKRKAHAFQNKVERLEAISNRLKTVNIENTDAIELSAKWDGGDTLIYMDPPYLDSTRVSRGDYETDNGSDGFHERLLSFLTSCKSKVVLSGYASEAYELLEKSGYDRIEKVVTSGAANGKTRTECLWVNFKGDTP